MPYSAMLGSSGYKTLRVANLQKSFFKFQLLWLRLPFPRKALMVGVFVAWIFSSLTFTPHVEASAKERFRGVQQFPTWYDSLDPLWTQPTLFTRPWLADKGIFFAGEVTQFAFGIAGGINNPGVPEPFGEGDTAKYTGRGEYSVKLDLEKVLGLPHGRLLIRAEHWWGTFGNISLNSGTFSPPVFPATLPPVPDSEGQLFLTNFLYSQPLHENFVVFVGKKDVLGDLDQDKFSGGDGTNQFMNQAFIANPAFLKAMPYSGFKGGILIRGKDGHLTGWVRDPVDQTENVLLNNLFKDGVIAGGELKVRINPWNLPGHQTVGGVWKGFDQPRFGNFTPAYHRFPVRGDIRPENKI